MGKKKKKKVTQSKQSCYMKGWRKQDWKKKTVIWSDENLAYGKKNIVYGVNILTGIQVSDFIESDSDRAVAHRIGVLTPRTYNQKCIFFCSHYRFPYTFFVKKKINKDLKKFHMKKKLHPG